jgi:hypothetical protein
MVLLVLKASIQKAVVGLFTFVTTNNVKLKIDSPHGYDA